VVENLAADVSVFTSNVFYVPGNEPALVDVGANFDVVSRLADRIGTSNRGLQRVLITHTHDDHVGNVEAVRSAFDVETVGWDPSRPAVDRGLADGDRIALGDGSFEIMHTPGHARDHCCAFDPDTGVLFAGDLVFGNGGVGRTDLPGSDPAALPESLARVRDRCADATVLHAGHGPSVDSGVGDLLARAAGAL
jgi:hydroxyacylglutathione hydrolase